MRRALRDRLAAYKIPQEMRVVDGIPRNAMGKGESPSLFPARMMLMLVIVVNKKMLVKEVFGVE